MTLTVDPEGQASPAFSPDYTSLMNLQDETAIGAPLRDLMAIYAREFPDVAVQSIAGDLALWNDVTSASFTSLPPPRQLWAVGAFDILTRHLNQLGYRLLIVKLSEEERRERP